MARLPNEALVVHAGENWPENFLQGSGVSVDADGKLQGVSVNAGEGASVEQLCCRSESGFKGYPHSWVGCTTVGQIRALGGDVIPSPGRFNPLHCTLMGLTADQASTLFRQGLTRNPNRRR